MALRPETTDDWRARARYARQKAADVASERERAAWLAIAHDYDERARNPCALKPSAIRVRAEISHVAQLAEGADPDVAGTVEELTREMRDVAMHLEALDKRQERKRAR